MINYGYFRHKFTMHRDPKIYKLHDLGGAESVCFYGYLLEIYGESFSNDVNKNTFQKMRLSMIANLFRLRTDSTRTRLELMMKCELIDVKFDQSDSSSVQVGVPNFVKYYGSYKKTDDENRLIKEKKRKEKKSKANTKEEKLSLIHI